jgi:myosin-5
MADKLEVYTKGTKAWFKDPEEGYVVGSLTQKTIDDKNVVLKFQLDHNKEVTIADVRIEYLSRQ